MWPHNFSDIINIKSNPRSSNTFSFKQYNYLPYPSTNQILWLYNVWCMLYLITILCHKHGGGSGMFISLHTSRRKFLSKAGWLSLELFTIIVGMKPGSMMCVSSPCFFSRADPCSLAAQLLILEMSTLNSFPHWNKHKYYGNLYYTVWTEIIPHMYVAINQSSLKINVSIQKLRNV